MRKALLVGIDDYPSSPLAGCVNDATRVHDLLCRHHEGSPNFGCRKLVSSETVITRPVLREAIVELFSGDPDIALLFFAGHGTVNNLGGYLVTPDAKKYDEGVPMTDVLTLANKSEAHERIIILDCCHSGALGQLPAIDNNTAILHQGVSVLSACRETEYAMEANGGGLFTSLVCDALDGGAADVCGKVTVASLYAYVDETLGVWNQRPLFKSHVSKLVSLRSCPPAVPPEILRLLPGYFKKPTDEFPLDPSYEPDAKPKHEEHEKIFGHLQKYRAAHLVVPVGEEHMYYAAMHSKSCKLTALGRFYWHLANSGKI
jgi:hypothetical protein